VYGVFTISDSAREYIKKKGGNLKVFMETVNSGGG
jgi:predicted CopG family antitoxin